MFRGTLLMLVGAMLWPGFSVGLLAQTPPPENPLTPLEWLVGETWVSETKRPNGQVLTIEAKYEWGGEKKAIKFSSVYKTNGQTVQVSEGTYFWHPGKKQLLMLQTGSGLTESVVQQQEVGLLHDNTLTRSNGSTDRQRALFVRDGDDTFSLKASVLNKEEWQEVVTFTYKRRRMTDTVNSSQSASASPAPKVETATKSGALPPKITEAAAALKVEDLAWMAGSWTERKPGVETQETWIAPQGDQLLGVNRTVRDSHRHSFEFLRIAKTATGISYFASPSGRPATEFPLVDAETSKVVFENLEQDFPQRIIYWKAEDGSLNARIEGTINGQTRSQGWRWESTSKK